MSQGGILSLTHHYLIDDFVVDAGHEGEDDDHRRAAAQARLERRDRELDDQELSKIAEDFTRRYKGSAPTRYTGDMNEIPQRLLMPSVHDANLWQVRVKVRS